MNYNEDKSESMLDDSSFHKDTNASSSSTMMASSFHPTSSDCDSNSSTATTVSSLSDNSASINRSPSPVALEPFVHQVGGHFPMICMDSKTVCKPLKDREFKFYKSLPQILKPFAPCFGGTMSVEMIEDEDGYITLKGQPPPDYQKDNCLQISKNKPQFRLKRNESLEIETVNSGSNTNNSPLPLDRIDNPVSMFDNSPNTPNNPDEYSFIMEGQKLVDSTISEQRIFYNPWALKCHRNHLKKIGLLRPASSSGGDQEQEKTQIKPQMYLLLENLVFNYTYPCILDLKVGHRQYHDDVSAAKKQRKIAKAANSTISSLGVRLSGMQVYDMTNSDYKCYNKYFGRSLNDASFKSAIQEFFSSSIKLRSDLIHCLIYKLKELEKIVERLDSYRFYTSSLLITYDANTSFQEKLDQSILNKKLIDVRIIDFAHTTHRGLKDSVLYSGPDEGFINGIQNFMKILKEIMVSEDSEEKQTSQ